MALKFFFLFFTGASLSVASNKWSYSGSSGPAFWHSLFPDACSGLHQSPIDIQAERTLYDPSLRDFAIWHDPPKPGSKMLLKNSGHSIQVDLEGEFFVTNAGLGHMYKPAQFHFHWGHHANHGSEHTLEGIRSPIEMHLVTYNMDLFPDIKKAATEKGGLAVLGVMFEVSEKDNPALENITKALKHVKNPHHNQKIQLHPIPLSDLLPGNTRRYFRYNGSLTTPGCYESVTWTVFADKQKISRHQLREFRKVLQFRREHHQGHRQRRESEARREEAAEAVLTELGVVGEAGQEAEFKAAVIEHNKHATPTHSNAHNKNGGHHHSHHKATDNMAAEAQALPEQETFVQEILVNNYRPVQPLNGRLVYRSFKLQEPPLVVEEGGAAPVYTAGVTGGHGCHGNAAPRLGASLVLLVTAALGRLVVL